MPRGHASRCMWRAIQKSIFMFCTLKRRTKRSRLYRRFCRNARLFQASLSISLVDVRAHPDVYKPLDDLDDDELDDESADDLDTATKKGDEKLNNGTDHTSISTENGKAKQGDGRKNENQVARSG
jgi:hypothetical protein